MSGPASALSVLIVEIVMVIWFNVLFFKIKKVQKEIMKELHFIESHFDDKIRNMKGEMPNGNSTICTHRNEPYRADNKSSLRDETNNKDSKAVH